MYKTMITYHTDMFIFYVHLYVQSNEHVGLSEVSNQTRVTIYRYGNLLRFRIPEFVPSLFLYPFVRRKRVTGTIMTLCSVPPRSPLPRQCREVCPRKTALRGCIPPPEPLSSTLELRQKATE